MCKCQNEEEEYRKVFRTRDIVLFVFFSVVMLSMLVSHYLQMRMMVTLCAAGEMSLNRTIDLLQVIQGDRK